MHLIVAFPNTTTYKHALNVMDLLSAEGKKAINKCEAVVGIRNVYDYLIHDTEDCRKKGKEQYDPSSVSRATTSTLVRMSSLARLRRTKCSWRWAKLSEHGFTNYMDFYEYVVDTYDDMNYIEVMRAYSFHFERLTRGNHHKWEQGRLSVSKGRKSVSVTSPDTLSDTPDTLSDTLSDTPDTLFVALLVALLMLRKAGKPLQERGVCVVRIAENPLLIGRRGTLSLGYYDPERA